MDQAVAGANIWRKAWLPRNLRAWGFYSSPVTVTTLKVWDAMPFRRGLTTFPLPMPPIVDNPDFPPGCKSEVFQRWRKVGC